MTSLSNRNFTSLASLCLLLAGGASAHAHTSYMLPNLFTANTENFVTVESAFAEKFFQPELAVDSADFHIILPDGSRAEFESINKHRQLVILESALKQDGTYRFTTGVRRGRVGKMALVNGKWEPVRGETAPAGAQIKTSQTETVADAYVTRKGPTRAPVDKQIGRLAIHPVTHPSDIAIDGGFTLKILFDGKPLADQLVVIDRGGADYDAVPFHQELKTGPDGSLALKFKDAGIYEIMTRHRADAPAGSETDERSYTTSLTFEVQR